MNVNNPMALLRDMAQETLTETTRALGGVQQQLQQAVVQHEQLQNYEREYQQSLRQGMMGNGMSVADLVNHQSFILSLKQVVRKVTLTPVKRRWTRSNRTGCKTNNVLTHLKPLLTVARRRRRWLKAGMNKS